MARKKSKFKLVNELSIAIIGGPFMGMMGGLLLSLFIGKDGLPAGIIIGIIFSIVYSCEVIRLSKRFRINDNHKYTIKDVKDYFGTPLEIIKDEDETYYRFADKMIFVKRGHIFTTDKAGNVIKYEVEDL